MQSIMAIWNSDKAIILGVALGISEALALIPALKSNSILQLIINFLKPKA